MPAIGNLALNGDVLLPDDAKFYLVFLDLAVDQFAGPELADWLRANIRPEKVSEPDAGYA